MFNDRLSKVRQKMVEKNIEAILVSHPPNVFYLSGFTGSSGFLLLTLKDAFLYTDFRYLQQAEAQAPAFEIIKVEGSSDYSPALQFVYQKGLKGLALEEAHFTLRDYNLLTASRYAVNIVPLFNFFEEIRAVKEEPELQLIARAAAIADGALKKVMPLLKPGISELDLACELAYQLRKGGSGKLPFEIIVASGERSALPHGVASSRVICEGELLTVDFGAVCDGYCSDMTRTFVLGNPSRKQQEIYNLVLEAQEMALHTLKVGQKSADVDAIVRQYFQQQGYVAYFGHGLGHGVGLEVHELPTLSPKGRQILQESMVFTLEPGIYIEGWGGVRIEDMVVLRPHGPQVLTGTGKGLALT